MKKNNLSIVSAILLMFAIVAGGCASKKHLSDTCGYHKKQTYKMWDSAK